MSLWTYVPPYRPALAITPFHLSGRSIFWLTEKTIPSCLIFNSLEFEGIKNRIIDLLSDTKKQHRVLALEPLLNKCATTIKIPYHISQRNIVVKG